MAGCSFATTFVKLYLMRRMDELVRRFPHVRWNVFIDDIGAEQTGLSAEAAQHVADAIGVLKEYLASVGCELAPAKTQVVSSSRWAARRVAVLMGLEPAQASSTQAAKFLGADFAPALPRRLWARSSTRRGRDNNFKKKSKSASPGCGG